MTAGQDTRKVERLVIGIFLTHESMRITSTLKRRIKKNTLAYTLGMQNIEERNSSIPEFSRKRARPAVSCGFPGLDDERREQLRDWERTMEQKTQRSWSSTPPTKTPSKHRSQKKELRLRRWDKSFARSSTKLFYCSVWPDIKILTMSTVNV